LGIGPAVGAASVAISASAGAGVAQQRPERESASSGSRKRRIVALEEHFATPDMMTAWKNLPNDEREPAIELVEAAGYDKYLFYLGQDRFDIMDQMGIDTHVLSLHTPGAQSFTADVGTPLARQSNDMVAELVRSNPTRYQGFGTLATDDPHVAAQELDRCAGQLGLNGILLNGRTRDRNLDEGEFLPIFEAAAARNFPIYLHPQSPPFAVRQAYYNGVHPAIDPIFNISGLGWHYETGVQALRLVMSGLFDRFPNLQIILGHWGEVVLFYLDRIDLMSKMASGAKVLKRPISDYFKSNIHVTPAGIYSQRYFRWACEVLGADRIMYATDYPYHLTKEQASRRFIEEAALSEDERDAVAHGNWDRLCAAIKR
jgi:predicted TIM-barrel fold metal-dependent hydrolase